MSIRTIIISLISVMGLLLAGICARSLLEAQETYTTLNLVRSYASADRNLFDALFNFRGERGDSVSALRQPVDKSGPTIKAALDKRDRVIKALDAAQQMFSSFEEPALRPHAARVRADYEEYKQIRTQVDSNLRLPLEQRAAALGDKVLSVGGRLLTSVEEASDAVEAEIRKLEPALSQLTLVRALAWQTRSIHGTTALLVNDGINQNRPWTRDETDKFVQAEGQRLFSWKMVRTLADRDGQPDELRAAMANAQRGMFAGPFAESRDKLIRSLSTGGAPTMTIDTWRDTNNVAQDALGSVPTTALTLLIQQSEASAATAASALAAYAVMFLVALSLVIAGFVMVLWRVTRPISSLTGAMKRLANGELHLDVPGTDRSDEIGSMAGAVQVFKDNMIRARELEAETEVNKSRAEAERKRTMSEMADEFERSVAGIVRTVSEAATGLQMAAQALTSSSSQTTHQSTVVAASSEQAAANVRTVAAAAEELSGSVREISRQVSESANIARKAVAEAEHTNAQVTGLSAGAEKIGAIVDLINGIASQTNLLALNATIEAARAGEAGRGFAVVAAEVKALAEQTSKATAEITSHIGSVQTATGQAANAILGIGRTIDEINQIASAIAAAVEEQGAATEEIARNVDHAAQGTTEVTRNITGVNQAAEASTASASQVLTSANELASQSEKLRREMDRFLATVRAA
jgi:methyl-accepting chemotaxis protein